MCIRDRALSATRLIVDSGLFRFSRHELENAIDSALRLKLISETSLRTRVERRAGRGLRVVFAGTPAFARVALDRLLWSRHPVLAVLTQPDRPAGRGQKPAMSPVKQAALAAGLPVLQPPSLRVRDATDIAGDPARAAASAAAAEAVAALRALAPDVMVVVAYGLILPPPVLDLPRLGCRNIHASLLPRWRGAAPIVRDI